MSASKTLGEALDLGALGVQLYCDRCLRRTEFDIAATAKLWPDRNLTFPKIAAKTRCKSCGHLARQAKPCWPMRARGGAPPSEQVPKKWGPR